VVDEAEDMAQLTKLRAAVKNKDMRRFTQGAIAAGAPERDSKGFGASVLQAGRNSEREAFDTFKEVGPRRILHIQYSGTRLIIHNI
jgi:hypothetical protein